jgi:predicted RNA-binding protein YlqC (UPF0109 family)
MIIERGHRTRLHIIAPIRLIGYHPAMTPLDQVQSTVELMIRMLVDNEQSVSITRIAGAMTPTLRITVAKDDVGKVIGKQGRTARSIRTVVAAMGMKIRTPIAIDIQDSIDLVHTEDLHETTAAG